MTRFPACAGEIASTAPGLADWTLQADENYTVNGGRLEFNHEASGILALDDGTELTFVGVARIEW